MSCTSSARIHASPPPQVRFVGGVDVLTTPPTILNAAIAASTTTPIRPCNRCIQSVARPASAPTMEIPPTKAEKVSDNGGWPRMLPCTREMERPKTVAEKSSCKTRKARVRMLSIVARIWMCRLQLGLHVGRSGGSGGK